MTCAPLRAILKGSFNTSHLEGAQPLGGLSALLLSATSLERKRGSEHNAMRPIASWCSCLSPPPSQFWCGFDAARLSRVFFGPPKQMIDMGRRRAIECAAFRYQAYKDGVSNEDILRQIA